MRLFSRRAAGRLPPDSGHVGCHQALWLLTGHSTCHYYNMAATSLIGRYESAKMAETHDSLLRHIPGGARVLEICCGSGRDAAFLFSEGYDVTAIDPSSKMMESFWGIMKSEFI